MHVFFPFSHEPSLDTEAAQLLPLFPIKMKEERRGAVKVAWSWPNLIGDLFSHQNYSVWLLLTRRFIWRRIITWYRLKKVKLPIFPMTSSVVFYYANELHEIRTMVRFGPCPFTPMVWTVEQISKVCATLTFSWLRLDRTTLSLLENRQLPEENYRTVRWGEKIDSVM